MTLFERIMLGVSTIIIAIGAAFLVGLWQADRRAGCFHHPHELPCPKSTWLGERVEQLLEAFGRRL